MMASRTRLVALVLAAVASATLQSTAPAIAQPSEGITNGGFESGLTGWTIDDMGQVFLQPTTPGGVQLVTTRHSGVNSVRVGFTSTSGLSYASLSQTFSVPAETPVLTFYTRSVCPRSFQSRTIVGVRDLTRGEQYPQYFAFDDNGTCKNTSWVARRVSLEPDHVYVLSLEIVVANFTTTANYTLYDDFRLVPAQNHIRNGGFENGFSSWTGAGGKHTLTNDAHTGNLAALLGAATATNGDSTIVQSLKVTRGIRILSLWYKLDCRGAGDYATVTLYGRDEFGQTGVTRELLPKTCTTGEGWQQLVITELPIGTWRLRLTSHDDNNPATPSSAVFDDIEVP